MAHRNFEFGPPVRKNAGFIVSLAGPGGSGKTYSALRLAFGIQSLRGGIVRVIDTDNGRAADYRKFFPDYQVCDFQPPFDTRSFHEAFRAALDGGETSVVIIDSMSDEHDGEGGVLEQHDKVVEEKGHRASMSAWARAKAHRAPFIQAMSRSGIAVILCFRAKDKIRPSEEKKSDGVVHLGWMPIAGQEYLYASTVVAPLRCGGEGVPEWLPEGKGEARVYKRPRQFKELLADGVLLDEHVGREMAIWASGEPQVDGEALAALFDRISLCESVDGLSAIGADLAALDKAGRLNSGASSDLRAAWKRRRKELS